MGCCAGEEPPAMAVDKREPLRYDPTFKGPLSKRSCTDVLCLLLFAVCMGVWVFVGVYALKNGDLNRLLVPTDTEGRKCGADADVIDKPYLLFFDLTKCASPTVPITGCPTPQVCVKQCPEETFHIATYLQGGPVDMAALRSKMICKPDVDVAQIGSPADARRLIEDEKKCAPWYLKSKSVSKRCIPSWVNGTITEIQELDYNKLVDALKNVKILAQANEVGTMIVEDVVASWWKILLALVAAMFVSLIYITMMRWIAAPMVWISIVGCIAILGYSIYLCFAKYVELRNSPVSASREPALTNVDAVFESYLAMKNTWLWLGIIVSVAFVIILLMIIFLRKRIVVAIALIKEGSKAVSSTTSTLLFPIFPWVLQSLIIAYAIVVGLYLAAVGSPVYKIVGMNDNPSCVCTGPYAGLKDNSVCTPLEFNMYCHSTNSFSWSRPADNPVRCSDATCHFLRVENPVEIPYFHGVNVVCFFWAVFFISALAEMILAATFATWYWTFKKSDVPFFTLTVAIGRTFRYHLGTIAFGSLIIAICRMIRVVLEYIDHKLKKYDNAFVKAIMCCMKCFFWCLENFLKFINRNAYIMCAIHGKNFCTSAKDAFSLLMRNVVRVFVLDKVTDFLFFLSKLLISVGVGAMAYTFFGNMWGADLNNDELHYTMVPVLIVALGTYFITCIFFGVYAMAVDTLFLCFLEDCERNDGSPEKPYYMSKQLMKILGKKNKHD